MRGKDTGNVFWENAAFMEGDNQGATAGYELRMPRICCQH